MGFVRPTGRNRRQTALFGALIAIAAGCLWAAAPADAALDDQARAEIHHQRGARELRAGNQEQALEWFEKALALDPQRPQTLVLKSRALLELGRADEAEAVTEQVRTMRPDDYDVTFMLALTAYRQQDWLTAKTHFEAARAQNPNDPRVHLYLGRAYQELGSDTQAEASLNEAARLDPEFRAPATFRLGILHLQRGETKQAKSSFEEVKNLSPGSELADQAELYLKLMSANQPRRFEAWVKLGTAYDSNMSLAGGGDLVGASDEAGVRLSLQSGASLRLFTWENVTMRAGITNYISRHDQLHAFDIQQVRPWLLTTWQPLEWLAFDTRFTHERVWRDYESFKNAHYVSQAVRILPAPGYVTRIFADYENREYIRAFEDISSRDRDGWVGTLGIDQYVPVPNPFSDGVAYFRLGWRFRSEDADGEHFNSQSHKPLATLAFALPWDMNISFDASFERRQFREISIFEAVREILDRQGFGDSIADLQPFNLQPAGCRWAPPSGGMDFEDFADCNSTRRLDKITQARIRLRKNIGKQVTLETYYRWVDWESSVDEFNFNRHIVGLAATFRR